MSNIKQQQRSILIIIRHGNRGDATLKEALDVAMVAAAFGQMISVLFVDDGVFHWAQTQKPEKIAAKAYHKSLEALALYDVEQVYLCKRSLQTRQFWCELPNSVKTVDQQTVVQLMESSDVIIDY